MTIHQVKPKTFENNKALQKLLVSGKNMCCPQIIGNYLESHVCIIPHSCRSLNSCNNLIREPVLQGLSWAMGFTAAFGNAVVIAYRTVCDHNKLNKGFGLYVFNLSLSDLLMGIYLLIISGADVIYKNNYVKYDEAWRNGHICTFAGFLATLSSETSAIFTFLIAVERFTAIKFPFGKFRVKPWGARSLCLVSWLLGLSTASVPLMFRDWEVYSISSMCVGLPLSSVEFPGKEYSMIVFIGINFILFLLIAVGEMSIYRAKSASDSLTLHFLSGLESMKRCKEDIAITKHLSVIVLTAFLCWFPIGVMGLMAMKGYQISHTMYAWAAVAIIPINSAINPLIYTMPALKRRYLSCKMQHFNAARDTVTYHRTSIRAEHDAVQMFIDNLTNDKKNNRRFPQRSLSRAEIGGLRLRMQCLENMIEKQEKDEEGLCREATEV